MSKKDDLSFRCFLKLLLEAMLSVNVQRHGCLLGVENICVGLGKRDAVVEHCTFELVLVTHTACGGNHERRQDFC